MYRIAGLNVSISGEGSMLRERAEPYRIDYEGEADLVIDVTPEIVKEIRNAQPHLSEEECAYIYTGEEFNYHMIDCGGLKLHASAVVLDGEAYLFSAPSGTGKSTHTTLWREYFGPERTFILNDDAPIIKPEGDVLMAWGSPWSGTSPLSRNVGVPLKAIAFLEQSQKDWIMPMDYSDALIHIMGQTSRTQLLDRLDKQIATLNRLLKTVPIFRMGCTISHNAVETAYAAMNKGRSEVCVQESY